ncbi:ABC transporter permease [Dietzia massiliensis]|uniref:ABC transporter permease n=1 Tax=Dietzia massiliensis TaxID=2697499 RepID=UPI001BCEBA93|nr:ABC transporter permease [Dietzia massiliensis]MBS7547375.1 ABC transporter permease [Dietzia massiliensis]
MTRPPLPRWLLVAAAVAVLLAALPLAGMAVRVPWARVPELLTSEAARDAAWLSLRTCALSTVLCVLLGTPLAVLLSRSRGPLAAVARTVTALPMVLPPVVAGLALLITFGRTGVVGRHLSVLGVEIGFTTAAVVIAQTFVAMPFLVVALEGALRSVDARLERTAASLGASPSRVLATVTLPLVLPALVAGATMSFARALGEFGATLTFAGSLQGTTRTLPLEIYLSRETDTETALALAVLLIAVAAVLMVVSALVARRAVAGRD